MGGQMARREPRSVSLAQLEETLHFVAHEGDFKLKPAHLTLLFDCMGVFGQFLCMLKIYGLHSLLEQFSIVIFWSQPNQISLGLVFQREK